MEDLDTTNLYTTALHNEKKDSNPLQEVEDLDVDVLSEERDFKAEIKIFFRFLRRKYYQIFRQNSRNPFINILYVTLDNPVEYITEMQKQYPNYNIRVLVPIINIAQFNCSKKLSVEVNGKVQYLEKTSVAFDFFLQNRMQSAVLYKLPQMSSNVVVYGLYSSMFSEVKSYSELAKLFYLAPFLKAVRLAVKKMGKLGFSPDIVHCENIPYYLGGEFETNLFSGVKVLQIIKDFTQIGLAKPEAFWAVINLADKNAMRKICRDEIIKKCMARLFNLHHTKKFYQMKDCLSFIYKNYYRFRKFIDRGDEVEENVIFNRLNARIMQIFPNIAYGEELCFNPMMYTMKKCDFWATVSKSYYREVFENSSLSGKMFEQILKTKSKSGYVSLGCDMKNFPREESRLIYQSFNEENFRQLREKNKSIFLKEFSTDRIKTNFIDSTLFKDESVKIYGSLDSFYDAPLFFAHASAEIFANGVDILFNTVLKLFELHKNVQVVICIKDGMKNNFIKNFVEFLSQNKYLNGKWVYIDGDINLAKFLASSDAILVPKRVNANNIEHLLAMHYGCVPVVSRMGFLDDTVLDIFDNIAIGCGFKTKEELLTVDNSSEMFISTVFKALNLYQNNPNGWNLLVKNCLTQDNSWNFKILEKYHRIYQEIL